MEIDKQQYHRVKNDVKDILSLSKSTRSNDYKRRFLPVYAFVRL